MSQTSFLPRLAVIATLLVLFHGSSHAAPPKKNMLVVKMTDAQRLSQMKADYQTAQKIDKMILDGLGKLKLKPNELMDEQTFLRRAYLNVVGRIPTAEEAQRYLDSEKENKELFLIDDLVNSEGYVSHSYNFWGDLLRLVNRDPNGNPTNQFTPYLKWVKQSIRSNMPYDDFVTTMLTSGGGNWNPDDAPSGFYRRDYGMKLDHLAVTMRVFAGTRMECAQCHDHPFDEWTQREFYELAAFTNSKDGRDEISQENMQAIGEMLKENENPKGKAAEQRLSSLQVLRRHVGYVNGRHVGKTSEGSIKLPHDYKYRDGKPLEEIKARTPFGKRYSAGSRGSWNGKAEFAEWLTSPEHPRFTTVIAHRLWKRMMGHGFYEPVDEIRSDTSASNDQALQFLTKTMIGMDYDMKRFVRMLCWTKLFRSEVDPSPFDPVKGTPFKGPGLRRMSAQQVWDSLLALREGEIDDRKGSQPLTLEGTYTKWSAEMKRNPRALFESLIKDNQSSRDFFAYHRTLLEDDDFYERKSDAESDSMMGGRGATPKDPHGGYVRASELYTPLKPTHLILKFGGSDRLLVDNFTTEASTPEALEMMNGFIDRTILHARDSYFYKAIDRYETEEEKSDFIYLSLLSRYPTDTEKSFFANYVKNNGADSWRDFTWAVLNSHQFRFIW